MSQEIFLTNTSKVAIVDDEDYYHLRQFSWRCHTGPNTYYAIANINGKIIRMHQLLIEEKLGLTIDHIDGDGLNNKRFNLRLATKSQQAMNTPKRDGGHAYTSQYKGVWRNNYNKKFVAAIMKDRKKYSLGTFTVEEDAARAYDSKAIELFGEFANLNFPKEASIASL